MLILAAQLARIYRNSIPYPQYSALGCGVDGWIIHTKDEQELIYERGRIVIDTALFFLLELSSGQKRRLVLVFFDQIDKESYRLLRIKEKVN